MAWKMLFESDIGLSSLATIVFMLGMGVYFLNYFSKKMDQDEKSSPKK